MRFILFILFIIVFSSSAETINTVSPDKNVKVSFRIDKEGTSQYMITYNNTAFLKWSNLGLNLKEGGLLSDNLKVISIKRSLIDETYPILSGKSKYGHDYCNETKILLEERSGLYRRLEIWFRAYNDGAAFRYSIPVQANMSDFVLSNEETYFYFAGDYTCWAMKKSGFVHNYEGDYKKSKLSGLGSLADNPGYLVTLPITIEVNPELYVCLSEAAITDYAGMYLVKDTNNINFKSTLSPHPDNSKISVTGSLPAETPWRVFIIGSQAGDLIESNMIMNLNKPNLISDVSWIKPGKSLWSWWTDDRGFDASFGYSIISTNTIKYHIDFAAANNIDYYTIDGGWYGWFNEDKVYDVTKPLPECDLPYLASYANSKGVGLFVWAIWKDIDRQMETALDYFQRLGIKGVKVDFMDRDDQYMVDFYHRIAKECANRKLMVNFHGSYKPDGLERTYPNLITRESVLANEYAKWDSIYPNPVHNVTIPYTRMVVGPMDYTPGSMVNVTKEQYIPRQKHPMTMGTRAQQIAMLIVYQSGILMLCESPKIYEQLPEFNLIKQVPASWDSTIVIDGKIGEYIIIARKKGNDWFIGAMTDWNSRDINIDFRFLENGEYECGIYSDADDADINPQNVKITNNTVNNSFNSSFRLAKGGGLAIILKKK